MSYNLDISQNGGISSMNALDRIFEATVCRTQVDLAAVLGIKQSSISDAKRRNSIPSDWLIKILLFIGITPDNA